MLVALRHPSLSVRCIHIIASKQYNLIAPPDPVSHMRPIIYSDAPPPAPPSLIRHPYSLTEFSTPSNNRGQDSVLQFKLHRQQLDDFHHNFWFDSNTRFEAAKEATLAGLPSSATPIDKEQTLSAFYKQWYVQEAARTDDYTMEWRRRNLALIKLGVRIQLVNVVDSLSRWFSFKNYL